MAGESSTPHPPLACPPPHPLACPLHPPLTCSFAPRQARVAAIAEQLEAQLRPLADSPAVKDVRGPTRALARPIASTRFTAPPPLAPLASSAERHPHPPPASQVRVLGAIGVVEMADPIHMPSVQALLVSRGVWLRPFGKIPLPRPRASRSRPAEAGSPPCSQAACSTRCLPSS